MRVCGFDREIESRTARAQPALNLIKARVSTAAFNAAVLFRLKTQEDNLERAPQKTSAEKLLVQDMRSIMENCPLKYALDTLSGKWELYMEKAGGILCMPCSADTRRAALCPVHKRRLPAGKQHGLTGAGVHLGLYCRPGLKSRPAQSSVHQLAKLSISVIHAVDNDSHGVV